MKKKLLQQWAALVLTLLMVTDSGCGTWLGNPKDPDGEDSSKQSAAVDLQIKGITSTSLAMAEVDVTNGEGDKIGTLLVTEALVVLKEIKLEPLTNLALEDGEDEEDGEQGDEMEFKGPYLADLLTDSLKPNPDSLKIGFGLYKKLALKIHKTEDEDLKTFGMDENDPIAENSIYIKGVYVSNDGVEKNFQMSFDLGEEFELENEDGIEFSEGEASTLLIGFNLTKWFDFSDEDTNEDGVDLGQISANEIVLDKDSEDEIEKEIREVIKENIKRSADIGEDADEDGKFDD